MDDHFIVSSMIRKQCAGVIFSTPGTVYLCCHHMVSLSFYAIFSRLMIANLLYPLNVHAFTINVSKNV